MNPIITDALTTAGELTRTVAANLRAENYGARDLRFYMASLADALVTDDTGISRLNDSYLLTNFKCVGPKRSAASERHDRRMLIADALTALSRDERIALIDALADGRNVIAA